MDMEALARFIPVRPEPVEQLPASGTWRVRAETAVFVFDLDAGVVRQWHTQLGEKAPAWVQRARQREAALGVSRHGLARELVSVEECVLARPLMFTTREYQGWPEEVGELVQREHRETSVVYLEALALDRDQHAGEHLRGWSDASLSDPVRVAHLCAATHFGAARAQLAAAVGLSGVELQRQWFRVISQAMVALRAGRGEPERVPPLADGSLRPVPRWMTEERLRRRDASSCVADSRGRRSPANGAARGVG